MEAKGDGVVGLLRADELQRRGARAEARDRGGVPRPLKPSSVWDLGGGTGMFSCIASEKGIFTVSLDADRVSIEKNYLDAVAQRDESLLPLVMDLIEPERCLRLGEPGAAVALRTRAGRGGPGAGAGPSPGDRQQRAARERRRVAGRYLPVADYRVRPEGGLAGADAARDAEGHLRRLHAAGFEAQFRERFRIVEVRLIAGSLRDST